MLGNKSTRNPYKGEKNGRAIVIRWDKRGRQSALIRMSAAGEKKFCRRGDHPLFRRHDAEDRGGSFRAYLLCIDDKGRESRLERLGRDDVFGEMFALPMERLSYFVVADTASDVLFIDYAHVISRCENACAYHSQLVHNLFQMTARKARIQTMHVSVLSQRTLRQKLLTYFELLCRRPDGTGRLDMSYSALADYLCIDRSAMMREIKKLKEEGLVAVEGKEIRLL